MSGGAPLRYRHGLTNQRGKTLARFILARILIARIRSIYPRVLFHTPFFYTGVHLFPVFLYLLNQIFFTCDKLSMLFEKCVFAVVFILTETKVMRSVTKCVV